MGPSVDAFQKAGLDHGIIVSGRLVTQESADRICADGYGEDAPSAVALVEHVFAAEAMVDALPANAEWAGFGISRMEMPMVAQAVLLGGHVRVGFEDILFLESGVLAS